MSTIVTALLLAAIGWSFLIACVTIRMILVNGRRTCGNIKIRKNDVGVLFGSFIVCVGLPLLYSFVPGLLYVSSSTTIMLLLGILYVLTFATDLQCKCWYKINKKLKQKQVSTKHTPISH